MWSGGAGELAIPLPQTSGAALAMAEDSPILETEWWRWKEQLPPVTMSIGLPLIQRCHEGR
jgi:hypothetical protein